MSETPIAPPQGYLGHLIAHYRNKRGMSLQDVADEARSTKAHIWDMEKGRSRNPTAETIFGLSVALDCDAAEILRCAIADLPGARITPVIPD